MKHPLSHDRAAGLALLGLLLLAGGCGPDIETGYGRRSDPRSFSSVNGTGVFADMIEQQGHKVAQTTYLSPRLLRQAECIVWFTQDFEAPSQQVIDWFDNWLQQDIDRKLIYVGRDYDAEELYWQKVIPQITDAKKNTEARQRKLDAAARITRERAAKATSVERCEWFTIDYRLGKTTPRKWTGKSAWVDDLDIKAMDLVFSSTMRPTDPSRVRAQATTDVGPLISSYDTNGRGNERGKLYLVTNGSFLLNVPLVNKEHRRLASKLIDEIPSGATVTFLEAPRGGPAIFTDDRAAGPPSVMNLFTHPPLDALLLHLVAMAMLFLFSRWAIFGRIRGRAGSAVLLGDRQQETTLHAGQGEFARHVYAMGDLLAKTHNVAYAQSRLALYHSRAQGPSFGGRRT